MAGTLIGNADDGGRSNEYLTHFQTGQDSINPPLQPHETRILRTSDKSHESLIDRDHYIQKRTGLDPVTFFRKFEELSNHPGLSKNRKAKFEQIMSRPGPQTGGSSIDISSQFGVY